MQFMCKLNIINKEEIQEYTIKIEKLINKINQCMI